MKFFKSTALSLGLAFTPAINATIAEDLEKGLKDIKDNAASFVSNQGFWSAPCQGGARGFKTEIAMTGSSFVKRIKYYDNSKCENTPEYFVVLRGTFEEAELKTEGKKVTKDIVFHGERFDVKVLRDDVAERFNKIPQLYFGINDFKKDVVRQLDLAQLPSAIKVDFTGGQKDNTWVIYDRLETDGKTLHFGDGGLMKNKSEEGKRPEDINHDIKFERMSSDEASDLLRDK